MAAEGDRKTKMGQPTAKMGEAAKQANLPSPGQRSTEVLHQTRKIPHNPAKLAIGGFAVVLGIAYLTLYSNKKSEANAVDVAKVTTGTANSERKPLALSIKR